MQIVWIVVIGILAATIVVALAKKIGSHGFRCRHCGERFRIPWQKVLVTEHSGNSYKLECPCCKVKDWCQEQ